MCEWERETKGRKETASNWQDGRRVRVGTEVRHRDVIAARGWHFTKTADFRFSVKLNLFVFGVFFWSFFFPFSGWTFFNLYLMCVSEWFYINLFLSFTCTDVKERSSAPARLDFYSHKSKMTFYNFLTACLFQFQGHKISRGVTTNFDFVRRMSKNY